MRNFSESIQNLNECQKCYFNSISDIKIHNQEPAELSTEQIEEVSGLATKANEMNQEELIVENNLLPLNAKLSRGVEIDPC